MTNTIPVWGGSVVEGKYADKHCYGTAAKPYT